MGTGVDMRFSVLMAVYAGDDCFWFKKALYSNIDKQELLPNEFILGVDGFIPDDIESVIYDFQIFCKSKGVDFKRVNSEVQGGLANILNKGLECCSFEWVARADADDLSVNNRFLKQIHLIGNDSKIDAVFSSQAEFYEDENKIVSLKEVPINDNDIKKSLQKRCIIPHSVLVYRKSLVLASGGYSTTVGFLEDYDLHLRMVRNGCVYKAIKEPLVLVKVSELQRQRRGGFSYAMKEIVCRFAWWRSGVLSNIGFWGYSPLYFLFRLTPAGLKKYLYFFVRTSN